MFNCRRCVLLLVVTASCSTRSPSDTDDLEQAGVSPEVGIKPQPDPPGSFPGPELDTSFLIRDVVVESPGTLPEPTPPREETFIVGQPGATEATSGEIWIWDWLGDAEPAQGMIQADGSFRVSWEDRANGPLRVQARSATGRGRPVDVLLEGAELTLFERNLDDCVVAPLELAIDEVGVEAILSNGCENGIVVRNVRLRQAASYDFVASTEPIVVEGMAEASLGVGFTLDDLSAGVEDLLLFEVTAAQAADAGSGETWAITLYRATPGEPSDPD